MPKEIIDITTPEEEEIEEEFPAVLATSNSKKSVSSKKKSSQKKNKEGEIIVENRGGNGKDYSHTKPSLKKQTKKERIRISFSLPVIALKIPLIILIIVVILGGVFIYLTLQAKAEVKIKPVLEPITIEDEIQSSSKQAQIDFEKKIIPSQIIEKEMEKWATFQSTGRGTEQSGASGTIFVYNEINPPTPLNLKEGTRFVSSKDGKIYKAKSKVSLPQATIVNGKIVASVTEVPVVAQQEGEEYNIAPAKFSVPGLAGTTLYYSIWGESKEKIDGGSQKEVQEITQQDMDLAKDSITKGLQAELLTALKEQVPAGFFLNQEVVSFNEPDISCSQEVGAKVAEFNCYLKLKATATIFKEADLKLMAKSFIESKLSSTKKLQEQSLTTTIKPRGGITENGDLVLDLKVGANLYNAIDTNRLLGDLAGESKDGIKVLLKSEYPQIERADVKLWPFWIEKAPKNLNKIKIDIIFSP
ncbi:MAG: hypothetical protein PHY72_00455 [Candidatus Pacebacteria bacterium]|nr:hypothetical protein [Candidatus Paceibacterota bacterium]